MAYCRKTGKVSYPDRKAARDALRFMRKCYCYRCPYCPAWHIATQEKTRLLRLHRH